MHFYWSKPMELTVWWGWETSWTKCCVFFRVECRPSSLACNNTQGKSFLIWKARVVRRQWMHWSKYMFWKRMNTYTHLYVEGKIMCPLEINLYFWKVKRLKPNIRSHQKDHSAWDTCNDLAATDHITWPRYFPVIGCFAIFVTNGRVTGSWLAGKDKRLHKLTADWLVHFQSEIDSWWCHTVFMDCKVELIDFLSIFRSILK